MQLYESRTLYGIGTIGDVFRFVVEITGIAEHVINTGSFGIEIDYAERITAEKGTLPERSPYQAVAPSRKAQVGYGVQTKQIARSDGIADFGLFGVLFR